LPEALLAEKGVVMDLPIAMSPLFLFPLGAWKSRSKKSDGLGMLVEQAPKPFLSGRGIRPKKTKPVIELLKFGQKYKVIGQRHKLPSCTFSPFTLL